MLVSLSPSGAFALDPVSGSVPVRVLTPLPINFTSAITAAPLALVYTATSSIGGFSSNATRYLSVVDPCSVSSSGSEFTCSTTMQCSINKR